MIGERLDVLPDVLYYHRPAFNDLRDFANVDLIFSVTKWLIKSSGQLTISRPLGGSPITQKTM